MNAFQLSYMSSGAKLINETNWLICLSILIAFKTNDQQINIKAQHNPLTKCCHSGNTVCTLLSQTSLACHACAIFVHRGTIWLNGKLREDHCLSGSFIANDWRHWYHSLFWCCPTERSISPWVKELDRDFSGILLCFLPQQWREQGFSKMLV